ncbi:MAG: hypothetical protein E7069_06865 [Bacteroidales bacterium]|jgi:hypothetical protein|nr:hypothetical protein [Bacteroidales bacterium]
MVTKFKTRLECALYIRKQVNMVFPLWEEFIFVYEGLPNGIMEVDYNYNSIVIQFQQDRGSLDFSVYKNDKLPSNFSWERDVHQEIIRNIPDIDPEWYCKPCYELVDFYINFLKERFDTFVWDE